MTIRITARDSRCLLLGLAIGLAVVAFLVRDYGTPLSAVYWVLSCCISIPLAWRGRK
jgi:hypothetical protein